jgi:5-methylcytosine-specific restriction endonuclease McrA
MVSVAEVVAAITEARQAKPETHRHRAQKFYASRAWRSLRFKILAANAKRNNGICCCELCGRSRRDGAILHVDHILPLSKCWERRLDPTNLQIFCDSCNLGKSNKDDTDFRPPESAEAPAV